MTKKAKGITYGVIGIAVIAAIIPSSNKDKKVESIELSIPDHQVEYDINTKIPIDIAISPTDAESESIQFISSSDSMGLYPDGIFTGDAEGSFDVYLVIDDVTSNIISINVVDISAREYAMVETEVQTDDVEQTTSQEDNEKQPSDDELNSQESTASQDAVTPTESDSTDQQTPDVQSDRDNEGNSSGTTAPPSIEEPSSGNNTEQQSSDVPLVEEPSIASAPTSSGNDNFDTYNNTSQQQTDSTYVLNTNTMKIHHPTCSSVPKIAPHNYATSNATLNELLAQGYTTCGICFR